MQHRWNTERVPDASSPPRTLADLHWESGGHGRKGSGSPELSILLYDQSMALPKPFQRGPHLARRRGKGGRHLRNARGPSYVDDLPIDVPPQRGVKRLSILLDGPHADISGVRPAFWQAILSSTQARAPSALYLTLEN